MSARQTCAPARVVVAVLVLVLMLSGLGRGIAGASDAAMVGPGPPGAFAICHAGPGGGPVPTPSRSHDCCEACALLAPAIAPPLLLLSRPLAGAGLVAATVAAEVRPAMARRRTPRQPQGPPAA